MTGRPFAPSWCRRLDCPFSCSSAACATKNDRSCIGRSFKRTPRRAVLGLALLLAALGHVASAAELTVDFGTGASVTSVGALRRWQSDGSPRRPLDASAAISLATVDAEARPQGEGRWVFENLEAGTYDLVVMLPDRVRLEGWTYAPVLEFDPFFPADSTVDATTRAALAKEIAASRHFENRVVPLYFGGEARTVRVLMMLIRDQPTSYETRMNGAATLRFEIWQFDNQYGGWVKQRRTKVLYRLILPREELRQWTWLWDAKLGGIDVVAGKNELRYAMPPDKTLAGLQAGS